MKALKSIFLSFALLAGLTANAAKDQGVVKLVAGGNNITLTPVNDNAIRVQKVPVDAPEVRQLPEWVYVDGVKTPDSYVKDYGEYVMLSVKGVRAEVNKRSGRITFFSNKTTPLLEEKELSIDNVKVQGEPALSVRQTFVSPEDEYLYGLGQFQDGYLNVRGLTRRLTQVNTQISLPFLLSSKGYGVLWNNYGMTDFNPCTSSVKLDKAEAVGDERVVDVTSTTGGQREMRRNNRFEGKFRVPESGEYAILLDVGQAMARRHHLVIDGNTIFEVNNTWLPPTSSAIVHLEAGEHAIVSELTMNDNPTVSFRKIDNTTTFSSPVASALDYTIMAGSADQVVSSYRTLTGNIPMLPSWALGYIHCRERYHSSAEILENASIHREKNLPMDVIVQDWQWWGKYGWNAMQFDEEYYPDPKALTDGLHEMGARLMLSVWSKIDHNCEVGKQAEAAGYYIPDTDWIDFFNPKAAGFYWKNFSEKLVPTGIDAWWQDATEPENDDLNGRRVMNGELPGEMVRNIYPLFVSKTVNEGLREAKPQERSMILTRCAFPGMQRYATATWSGDVGNDWETLRRQIVGGLGMMASGQPWWTYDAGGFFRPRNQYDDAEYQERMLRWLQASVFLPLMRVHGYMSNTELWRYGADVENISRKALELRYRLMPYIYSLSAFVNQDGGTLMRPLVMDFAGDSEALDQDDEFMFGPSLLVAPVLQDMATINANGGKMSVYLPEHAGGWYDFRDGTHYDGGEYVKVPVTINDIPVFVKAGSIIPMASKVGKNVEETLASEVELHVYRGADARFSYYEDSGVDFGYENGEYALTDITWENSRSRIRIGKRHGSYPGMQKKQNFKVIEH